MKLLFSHNKSKNLIALLTKQVISSTAPFFIKLIEEIENLENGMVLKRKWILFFNDTNYKYLSKIENKDISEIDYIAKETLEFIRKLLLITNFTDGLAFDLLKAWEKYQDIIFLTRSTYRDHFIHQFYVFLTGCFFLDPLYINYINKIKEKNKKLKDKEESYKEISRARFFRRWFLASVFHDIGYPAESLKDIHESLNNNFFNKIPNFSIEEFKLKTIENDSDLENLIEQLCKIHLYSEFIQIDISPNGKENINKNYSVSELYNLFRDEINQTHDHGVSGAIYFLKTAMIDMREMVIKPNEAVTCRKEVKEDLINDIFIAASAIAGHNLRSNIYPYYTIDFFAKPIAALLNFCDDLQEWDRKPNDPFWDKRRMQFDNITIDNNKLIIQFADLSEQNRRNILSDDDARKYHKSFINSIVNLFRYNLCDEDMLFFNEIEIKSLFCKHNIIINKQTDENSYEYGRFLIDVCEHQQRGKNFRCLHCILLENEET